MKELKIEKLDHQGRGISKIDNKPFFIANTLPGEVVKVKILEEKKKYGIGEVESFIKISEKRVKPQCPYFEVCGGCDLQHIKYEDQLTYKKLKIVEIMKKFAGINEEKIKPIISSENPLYYRNKVTFQIDNGVGFYGKKSNDLILVDYCFLVTDKINKILKLLNTLPLSNIEKIIVKSDKKINEIMVILEANGKVDKEKIIDILKEHVTSIILKDETSEHVLYGNEYIIFSLGNYNFEVSPSSFFQVNLEQCEKLYETIVKQAEITKEDIVLDLYCGTGTIGIYVSEFAKKVYGIEINSDAVLNANANKKRNKVENIEFQCGDCGKVINRLKIKPNIIIVDPPRRGLDKNTISQLLKWKSRKIVYVSCDPITLARDLKLLQEKYHVEMITPVDMFPNTAHVECVCLLYLK